MIILTLHWAHAPGYTVKKIFYPSISLNSALLFVSPQRIKTTNSQLSLSWEPSVLVNLPSILQVLEKNNETGPCVGEWRHFSCALALLLCAGAFVSFSEFRVLFHNAAQ